MHCGLKLNAGTIKFSRSVAQCVEQNRSEGSDCEFKYQSVLIRYVSRRERASWGRLRRGHGTPKCSREIWRHDASALCGSRSVKSGTSRFAGVPCRLSRPSRWTSGSRRSAGETDRFGDGRGFLDTVSDHAQSEGVCVCLGLILRAAIGEDAGNVGDLGDPAAVILALGLDIEAHILTLDAARRSSLSRGHRPRILLWQSLCIMRFGCDPLRDESRKGEKAPSNASGPDHAVAQGSYSHPLPGSTTVIRRP